MASKIKEPTQVYGHVTIIKNGEVIHQDNLLLTDGKKWIAERITGANNPVTHLAVGTGTTAADVGQTELVSELARKALEVSGGSVNGAVATFRTTFREGEATGALTEAGLFLSSAGGRMTNRAVFPVVNKGANDIVTFIWDIEIL